MSEALAMDLAGWALCSGAIVLTAYGIAGVILGWGRGPRR